MLWKYIYTNFLEVWFLVKVMGESVLIQGYLLAGPRFVTSKILIV